MGDRTNVVIAYKSTEKSKTLREALMGSVVLYSHWGGYEAGPTLAKALRAAQSRWSDEGYGARIIFSQFIGNDWTRETGYGIYAGEIGDNEHAVFVVDFAEQKVRRFGSAGQYLNPESALDAAPTADWSFGDFSALTEDGARAAHLGERA